MSKQIFKISLFVGITFVSLLLPPKAIFSLEETNVKAYFIYQFTKFIEWPSSVQVDPLVIAVWGHSEITKPLQIIASEKSEPGQKLVVNTVEKVEKLSAVHILFIPKEHSDMLPTILNALENKHIVVITEKNGMAKKGSAINFVLVGNKIGFEINLESFKKNNLYISSRLLRLAVEVYGE
ncbi:MAG: YfiR family protein [Leptospirales bacterium]